MKRSVQARDLCRRAVIRTRWIALGLASKNRCKHAKLRNPKDPSQPHRWRLLLRGYRQCQGYDQAFASFTSLLLQTHLALQCPAFPNILTNAKSMKLHIIPRAQVSYYVTAMSRVYAFMGSIQIQALLSFVADFRPAVLLCSGLSWCGLDAMPHGRTTPVGSCSHQQ